METIAFGMPGLGEWILLFGCTTIPLAAAGVTVAIVLLTRKPPPTGTPRAFPVQPMPAVITRFRIQATERSTGAESTFELSATTVDEAREAAVKAGYNVQAVEHL